MDEEHFDRLRKGVAEWNAWRRGSNHFPKLDQLDLRGANLWGFDLTRASLSGANLCGANLSGADLRQANLREADLSKADLSGANLRRADVLRTNLSGANLFKADLSGASLAIADLSKVNLNNANLSEAMLFRTDLSGANLIGAILVRASLPFASLREANLTGARLDMTVLEQTELTGVVGLDACWHTGPSVIDFMTLEKSHPLPLVFLQGIGLPDKVIDYLPSLLNQPIQYFSCFISYSSKDEDFAKRIHSDLQSKGVRCWFAPHDLPMGGKILDEIDAAIRLRDKVLLILSEHSIDSGWVEDEVKTGYEEERKRKNTVLFPISLDDTVLQTKKAWAAKLRSDRNIGDFRYWKDHDQYQVVLERVLRDLSAGPKKST